MCPLLLESLNGIPKDVTTLGVFELSPSILHYTMSNLTPQQNRVEGRSTSTSPPPSSQTSPPTPSGIQALPSNDETHFFTNNSYKKHWVGIAMKAFSS